MLIPTVAATGSPMVGAMLDICEAMEAASTGVLV